MFARALLTLAVFFVCLPLHASDYQYDFVIKKHDVHIDVRQNSVLDIKETFTVYFNADRQGIFLDIPFIYREGDTKGTAKRPGILSSKYKILLFDVSSDTSEIDISSEGAFKRIRLGTPGKYLSGEQTFNIRYKVFGAVNFFTASSEVYWNIHGTQWKVPTEAVNFSITLPKPLQLLNDEMFVYTGERGSRQSNAEYSYNGQTLSGTTAALYPQEGVTAGIKLPNNYLSYGNPFLRLKLFIANNITLLISITYTLFIFMFWFRFGRNDSSKPVMVYYEPPEGVSPSVAGVLADDDIDNRDLVAVFLKWGAEKIIDIEETEEPSSLLGKRDYIFSKRANLPSTAPNYERTLFGGLFPADIKHRRLSALKNVYYPTMNIARKELEQNINTLELYKEPTRFLRSFMMFCGILIVFAGIMLAAVNSDIQWFVSFAYMGIITLIFGKIMPKRTPKGQELFLKIAGFREFIQRAEKDKLERMLAKNPEYFNITVPYALVFGMLAEWGSKFDGLLSSPPEWFKGSAGDLLTMAAFTRALDRSVSDMSSSMTSTPAPEGGAGGGNSGFGSGGGGGGFSGGGFGGGGGGSW